MATKTSAQSGAWSAGATWVGGVAPIDNDAVTIAAGHEVLMDADLSAFTGLQTVTITGSDAGTPGMLYWKNGTSGTLKIRTGYHLVGTAGTANVTTPGRLLANADGVWATTTPLDFASKAVILLQGTSKIQAHNLAVNLRCTEPTVSYVEIYGTLYGPVTQTTAVDPVGDWIDLGVAPPALNTYVRLRTTGTMPGGLHEKVCYFVSAIDGNKIKLVAGCTDDGYTDPCDNVDITSTGSGQLRVYTGVTSGSATVNVVQDVTGVTGWSTTAGHNRVALVDMLDGSSGGYDQQRTTVNTINAATIVLDAVLDSDQGPLSRLYITSRNVSIRSAGTTSTQAIVDYTSGTGENYLSVHNHIACEITNTAGSGTTFYGYAVNDYDFGFAGTPERSITIAGCISGVNGGIVECSSRATLVFTSIIVACYTALQGVNTVAGSGTVCHIAGCSTAIRSNKFAERAEGTIQGCTAALDACNVLDLACTVEACGYVVYQSLNIVVSGESYAITLYFALNSSGIVLTGSLEGVWQVEEMSGLTITNGGSIKHAQVGFIGGTLAAHGLDTSTIKQMSPEWGYTAANYGSRYPMTLAIYDVDDIPMTYDCYCPGGRLKTDAQGRHIIYAECDFDYVFLEIPFVVKAGRTVIIPITAQLDGLSTWDVLPTFSIRDPNKAEGSEGATLDSFQMVSNEQVQSHTLSYTAVEDRTLSFLVRSKGGVTTGLELNLAADQCIFTFDIEPAVSPIASLTTG